MLAKTGVGGQIGYYVLVYDPDKENVTRNYMVKTNDLVGVQRALGHSSMSTTESMYVHHSLAEHERELVLEDEAETLDELSRSVTSESVRRDSEHFAIKNGELVQPDPKESAAVEKLLQKTFQERYRAPR